MMKLELMHMKSRAMDWACIIFGLLLLAAWVQSAHELSFLLGLVLFILGCALRSRWQTKQLKDDL
jgi:hypothetical protein